MLWLRNNIWDHKRFKLTFWHKILYTKFHLWPSKVLSLSLSLSLKMVTASSIQFIDSALSCTTSLALSYSDPEQKWIIQKHLTSLLQDYPTLNPSIDTFIHNDGTTVNFLNANGYLFVSHSSPPIAITIWLHENYPYMAPIVFVTPNHMSKIHPNHPFVDPFGATKSAYLLVLTWQHPRCNLTDVVHNLVKTLRNWPSLVLCFT